MSNNQIRMLDRETAEKIAAGEVITRPLSVVKELVENSLDAQSEKIVVRIEDGGRKLITVVDDGSGMTPEGARMAIKRHATSKIVRASDLEGIRTLGFRGEALSSIAAISRMELITRPQDLSAGFRLQVEGGEIRARGPVGSPPGTRVTVRDLFYNTPARRKNMNKVRTEITRIRNFIQQMALAFSDVAFVLEHNGRQNFRTPGRGQILEVLNSIYDRDTVHQFMAFSHRDRGIGVQGYVSHPAVTRASARHQSLFVNGRFVQNDLLRRAVSEAFHTLVGTGRHPLAVVLVDIDPQKVDVNIHPRKSEIRFHDEKEVYGVLLSGLEKLLSEEGLIPEIRTKERRKNSKKEQLALKNKAGDGEQGEKDANDAGIQKKSDPSSTERAGEKRAGEKPLAREGRPSSPREPTGRGKTETSGISAEDEISQENRPHQPERPERSEPDGEPDSGELWAGNNYRIIDQIFQSYILVEAPKGLYIVDQHAAQERVLYERLNKRVKAGRTGSQRLLVPVNIRPEGADFDLLCEHRDVFLNLGFEFEEFTENTLMVRSVPRILLGDQKLDDRELLLDLLEDLGNNRRTDKARLREDLLVTTCCRAAVKAGDKMSKEEMEKLLSDLTAACRPYTCPHGRPTVIKLGVSELEKEFQR